MTRSRHLILALLCGAAAPLAAQTTPTAAPPAAAQAMAEDQRLVEFLDQAFDAQVALSPEASTSLGLKTDYDKLDDTTNAADERRLALAEAQLAEMTRRFSPDRLSEQGQLNYRLFAEQVKTAREQAAFRDYAFPVSTNGSPAGDIPVFLVNQHRVDTVADAEAYIARLNDSARVMRETADRMRAQAARGVVPPAMVFAPARADAQKALTGAPFEDTEDGVILADFKAKVAKLDADQPTKDRLVAQAAAALSGPYRAGFDTLFAALDEIEPKATGNDGAWSLPNGDAYYQSRLRYYTTTDLTADQIHTIGLEQVAKIRTEMEAVKARVGFTGTLPEFFVELRTDPKWQYPNDAAGRERYLTDARADIAQTMEAAPRFFRTLPKADLEVRAVEPFRQDTASVAFYNRPAPDGSRPGIFYVNLADMTQVQKTQVEAIAHHEGAPGHHFQIARAQELPGLPKFRRFGFYGAYGEGWGLYSERLAKEMGAYTDPYSEFGMLSLQMWRAIRLVTDTGMHSKRWSRERAIDYFRDNAPLSERDIVKEVDRYLNNPGQATSYMIGQLKISDLRARAERDLGDRFDIRDFHEAVLGGGAVPLDVLEDRVLAYIRRAG